MAQEIMRPSVTIIARFIDEVRMLTRFGICLAITVVSALVSLGFSVAAILNQTGSARTLALYAAARSLALTAISFVPLRSGSVAWLEAGAVGMIIVQSCDAAIGVVIKDRLKTIGPAATAVANLVALVSLLS
jgi:hypothetical protein